MERRLLPPATCAVVRFAGPRPEATHLVEFRYRHDHRRERDELLGTVTCDWTDPTDQRRIADLKTRMYLALRTDWQRLAVDIRPLREKLAERRMLSDLQRFKRKMGMVLRKYEEEKAAIARLERGIPQLALERLNADLQEAWAQAERIYGCTIEDFYRTQP